MQMIKKSEAVDKYIAAQPQDRQNDLNELRDTLIKSLPSGFEETIGYGMPAYVVPHSMFPRGYHCDPKQPLPFVSFANQKNFIALYHMGIYVNTDLLNWFTEQYPLHSKRKLDMGKSCIRFKPAELPIKLLGELLKQMTPKDWILLYEAALERR